LIKSPSINHSSCHQHPNNTLEKAVVYLCKFVIVLTEIDVIGFRCYNALLKTVESKTVMYSPATAYAYTSVKAYTAVLKDIAAAEVHAATLCILLQPFDVVLEQCLNCSLIQSGALVTDVNRFWTEVSTLWVAFCSSAIAFPTNFAAQERSLHSRAIHSCATAILQFGPETAAFSSEIAWFTAASFSVLPTFTGDVTSIV